MNYTSNVLICTKRKNIYNKKILDNLFNIVVFIIYFIVTIFIVRFHEPWNDEAQSYLISRDLSIPQIISQMKYEGHSALWNIILYFLIKLGFSYKYIGLISCFFIDITVLLILYKLDIKKILKLFIIFSAPFLYFFSIISRCYCLVPLGIILLCILHKRRDENSYKYAWTLAFLANTHVTMLSFVGILLLLFIIPQIVKSIKMNDKEAIRKYCTSFLITLIGITIALVQVIDFKCELVKLRIEDLETIGLLAQVIDTLLCFVLEITISNFGIKSCIIVLIFLFVVLLIITKWYRKYSLILWTTLAAILLLNGTVRFISNVQRSQIFILCLFFFIVIMNDINMELKIPQYLDKIIVCIFTVICLLGMIDVMNIIKQEIEKPYSDSKSVAKFIQEHVLQNDTIYVMSETYSMPSVVAYFDKDEYNFFDVVMNRYFSYFVWDNATRNEVISMETIEKINSSIDMQKKTYLLAVKSYDDAIQIMDKLYSMNLVYSSPEIVKAKYDVGEEYYIYELSHKNNI